MGLVLSAWGVLQLAATGLCLHLRSPAFVEDVSVGEVGAEGGAASRLGHQLDLGYARSALNCWVAALLYGVTLCLSLLGRWSHQRTKEVGSEQFY